MESFLLVRGDMNRQECRELAENSFLKKEAFETSDRFDPFDKIKSDSDMLSSVKHLKSNIGRHLTQTFETSRRLTTGTIKIDASKEALQKGTANILKTIRKTIHE